MSTRHCLSITDYRGEWVEGYRTVLDGAAPELIADEIARIAEQDKARLSGDPDFTLEFDHDPAEPSYIFRNRTVGTRTEYLLASR